METGLTGLRRPEVEQRPKPSGPNNVPGAAACPVRFPCSEELYYRPTPASAPNNRCSTLELLPSHSLGRLLDLLRDQVLLRKEVIQPHLPVRLPCYDFVPIADPTFDGSLHKGWATGFGCYRLS